MTATYNEQILLSVIVPVYNAEEYLSDCLASIRKSNYQNIEVILVNDGSTDSSPSICNVYSCKDPRFKTVHIQNGGVSHARNIGIRHCSGEYITFVDADDLVEPSHFDDIMIQENEDFVYSGYKNTKGRIVKEENKPDAVVLDIKDIKKNLYEFWKKVPITFVWCGCYKRHLIISNNLKFDENSILGEDVLFNIDYLKVCNKIRISSSSGYLHSHTVHSLVHRYYANRGEKEEKECRAWEELSGCAEYRLRWYAWHVALKHYETWLNSTFIPKEEIKHKMKACYNNPYFRESIKYIRKSGSLDEKVESYLMRSYVHKMFRPLWQIILKISGR